MKKMGLIGYPLSHSFSKKYFTEKFEKEGIQGYEYDLYPLESIDRLPELIANTPQLTGLNVTIPYKEAVIPYLDEVDESAVFGAVNTIKIENGRLTGFNTDVYGFEMSIKPLLKSHHKKALILGTGGASKAIEHVLNKLGIHHKFVSRTPSEGQLAYSDLDTSVIKTHTLIVNTTPLGMSPSNTFPEMPYEALGPKHLLFDLVYNPEKTVFLELGASQNAITKNGLEMLFLQAEKAWEIWTGNPA